MSHHNIRLVDITILSVLLDFHLFHTFLDGKCIRLRWVKRHGQADSILGTVFLDIPALITVRDRFLPACINKKSNQVGPHVVATLEDVSLRPLKKQYSMRQAYQVSESFAKMSLVEIDLESC